LKGVLVIVRSPWYSCAVIDLFLQLHKLLVVVQFLSDIVIQSGKLGSLHIVSTSCCERSGTLLYFMVFILAGWHKHVRRHDRDIPSG